MAKVTPVSGRTALNELDQMMEEIWDSAKASRAVKANEHVSVTRCCFVSPECAVGFTEHELLLCKLDRDGHLTMKTLKKLEDDQIQDLYSGGLSQVVCRIRKSHSEPRLHFYEINGENAEEIGTADDAAVYSYHSACILQTDHRLEIYSGRNRQPYQWPVDRSVHDLERAEIIAHDGELLLIGPSNNAILIHDIVTGQCVGVLEDIDQVEHLAAQKIHQELRIVLKVRGNYVQCLFLEKREGTWVTSTDPFFASFDEPGQDIVMLTLIGDDQVGLLLEDSSVVLVNVSGLRSDSVTVRPVAGHCEATQISHCGILITISRGLVMKKLPKVHWTQKNPLLLKDPQFLQRGVQLCQIHKLLLTGSLTRLVVSGRDTHGNNGIWIWNIDGNCNFTGPPIILLAHHDEVIDFEIPRITRNPKKQSRYYNRGEVTGRPREAFTRYGGTDKEREESWQLTGGNAKEERPDSVLFTLKKVRRNALYCLVIDLSTERCLSSLNIDLETCLGNVNPASAEVHSSCFFSESLSLALVCDDLFFLPLSQISALPMRIKLPNEELPTVVCEGTIKDNGLQEFFVGCYEQNGQIQSHSIVAIQVEATKKERHYQKVHLQHEDVSEFFIDKIRRLKTTECSTVECSETPTKTTYLRGHTTRITCLCSSNDDQYLISGSINREIFVWRLWKKYYILVHHVSIPEETRIFTTPNMNTHEIASLELSCLSHPREVVQQELKTSIGEPLPYTGIPKTMFLTDKNLVALTTDNILTVWDLTTWAIVGSRKDIQAVDCIKSENEVSFWLYREGAADFIVDHDPDETLFGCRHDRQEDPKLIENLLSLSAHKPIRYTPDMNPVVLLNHFGVLQLYAYRKMTGHFKKALADGAPLTNGQRGYNVLTVIIKTEQEELIDCLLEHLRKTVKTNRYVGHLFSVDSLTEISRLTPYLLPKLFTSFFVAVRDTGLPVLGSRGSIVPNTKPFTSLSQILDFTTELRLTGRSNKPRTQRVKYKQFLVPVNSDKLVVSLLDYPNRSIFANSVVTVVLDYRWKSAQKFAVTQAILYMGFLALLTVHALESFSEPLYAAFVLTLWFLLYEMAMVLKDSRVYFKDKWNYADILIITMSLVHFGIAHSNLGSEVINWVQALLLILVYFRGVNYFSCFGKTRYMTLLLWQVVKDILPFAGIVFYAMLCFSALFALNDADSGDIFYFSYLSFLYRVSLGDFETEEFGYIKFALFFVSSFFLSVMMLNLLIAILSDSFDQVQDNRVSADNYKRSMLILEYELFRQLPVIRRCFRKQNNDRQYLAQCFNDSQFPSETWEGWQHSLKKEVSSTVHQHVQKVQADVKTLTSTVKALEQQIKSFATILKQDREARRE